MTFCTKDDKHIIVGSTAFFSCYDDFKPHDKDILVLVDYIENGLTNVQIRIEGNCKFVWKRMAPDEFISCHKDCPVGLFLGKFLVREFVDEIGFSVEHLKQLSFLLDYLDDKHLYEKIIYDSYIENNKFELTQEQLDKAYEVYKKYR